MKSQKESYLRVLLVLGIPAIIEQFLMTLVSYVDTAMVGSLGAGATAAVAINASSTWLINGVLSAVGVGYSVQVAFYAGAKDFEQVRAVVRQAVLAVVFFGLVIMAVGLAISGQLPVWLGAEPEILSDARAYIRIYMLAIPFQCSVAVFSAIFRCMGDTKTPMTLNAASNLINVVLNYFLIFETRPVGPITMPGAGLGVAGAAIATSISIATSGTLLLVIMYRRKSPYQVHLKENYKPDKFIIRKAFQLSVPVALERITMSSGQIFMTKMVSGLGTAALAANHVAVTAEGLSYMPATGISFAATTLVGQSLGAKNMARAKTYGKLSGWVGFALSTFMGALLFFFSQPLATIFSSDHAVINMAAAMLRIVAFAEPMFGVSIVLSGALRGAGDTRYPFFVGLFSMVGLRCVLAPIFIYGLGMGLEAVWIAMLIDLCVRGLLCIWRFGSGKWERYSAKLSE